MHQIPDAGFGAETEAEEAERPKDADRRGPEAETQALSFARPRSLRLSRTRRTAPFGFPTETPTPFAFPLDTPPSSRLPFPAPFAFPISTPPSSRLPFTLPLPRYRDRDGTQPKASTLPFSCTRRGSWAGDPGSFALADEGA